ncbi:response regulator transcription factor [Streptomyces sp. NBC_01304]|uniref:response regulator transcription factor n=1 Tax=Streptomyces sp. NBC_01304 TaxID=2903818 RepID=UPI002E1204DA|nr:response regulator transcription factor [Streptomyces sp. NBC_01304]
MTPPGTPGAPAGSGPRPRILVVEDDDVIREATTVSLTRLGFDVTACADGASALHAFRSEQPEAVVTDVMLPELDGVSLTRSIRANSTVPVLMISARGDDIDVIAGLEAGADDYVTKPFRANVLAARLRALMRRTTLHPAPPAEPEPAPVARNVRTVGELELNTDTMEVRVAGALLAVTPTELRLLIELTSSPGVVFSREKLLQEVWDYAWGGDTRVVDVHVQRLRAKIGAERLVTVRGFGYKIVG